MERRRIVDFLPEMYGAFVPDVFERPLGEERHATCEACAMCPPADPVLPLDAYYSPSTKCCTFHPALPNYAVGGLLSDDTEMGAEGRRRLEQKIEARIGVTPFGVLPPARYLALHQQSPRAFGRAESLVCPYLDRTRGACTVWAHREGECATWFCKHNNGFDGREFWKQLRDYLVGASRLLSAWAMRELGFDPEVIARGAPKAVELDAQDLDERRAPDAVYARQWGPWVGREREFYRSAFDLVSRLDRERFSAMAGLEGELARDRLERRYDAMMHPRLPDPLQRNPDMRVERAADGSYLITSYPSGEPTRLKEHVYRLLDEFDGRRSTADVREVVRTTAGLRLGESFLVTLYQHRVLVDPADLPS